MNDITNYIIDNLFRYNNIDDKLFINTQSNIILMMLIFSQIIYNRH